MLEGHIRTLKQYNCILYTQKVKHCHRRNKIDANWCSWAKSYSAWDEEYSGCNSILNMAE